MQFIDRIRSWFYPTVYVYDYETRISRLEERVYKLENPKKSTLPIIELPVDLKSMTPIPGYKSLAARRKEYQDKSRAEAEALRSKEKV